MTGASLIASPALANDSNRNSTSSPTSSSSPSPSENAPSPSSSSESHSSSSFRITQEKTFVSASTNSSFTVSGTGCTGQQATVGIALYAPDGTVSDIVKTEAAADGSWSTDLDLAALIKSIGSSTATTTDGWTIGAGCMTYGGKTETVQTTTQQQTQIFFDDTRISGSYEVSARTETQSQTFTFNAQGFYAGETVTVLLKHKSDSSIRYTLGELTVDANGNLVGNLPAPTDAADGEYLLVLTGSHHGETATSKTITTVSNHTFTIKNSERSTSENETTENNGGGGETQTNGDSSKTTERSTSEHETTENNGGGGETQTNGGGEDKTTTDQQVNNQTNRSKSVSSGTKESSSDTRAAGETNTNNGKSLAHTGANGLIFGGIAALLVAIGGAVLFLRRRNKA
ncbi:LPXTG-motif protein cell wall anchor domain protein [Actinomyces johnsonii F0510]|uniref:LPXTG-motif protein cell wall anchor domain protein n=2 Tax=Actinomyces johnsonii TaxID=544581 RepID=U1Q6H4_9ACTO|nr:LPXTG-motif protein cell wall anchor domain protein [Actinomyces johnsonii F0510]